MLGTKTVCPSMFDRLLRVASLSFFFLVLTCALYYVTTNPEVDKTLYEEIQTELGDNAVTETNLEDLVFVFY